MEVTGVHKPEKKEGFAISKQLTALLITFLFIFTGSVTVSAHEQTDKKVDATSLLMREAPEDGAEVLGTIPGGSTVSVQEEKYGWANVDYNGQNGWVAAYYLVSSGADTSSSGNVSTKVTVQADSVRLRSGPGTSHRILGVTEKGDTYSQLGKENGWVKVRLGDGNAAWIAGFLTSEGSAAGNSANTTTSSSAGVSSLGNATVVVDAGHGGYEPGAIGRDGTLEKDLTLSTAQTVASALRYAGADVIMTRTSNRYVSLPGRASTGSTYGADAFVSVHYNSSRYESAKGVSTYYYGSPSLAAPIQNRLVARTSYQDDGTRHGDFHVLRENSVPAVLLELGYVSNAYELTQAKTQNHREQVAQAVTEGLRNYFAN